jgi:hyperosmotically inducible protein
MLGMAAPASAADFSDAWITTKAKMALLTTEGIPTTINVDTVNGKVTLHGKVGTEAEKAKAGQVAGGIQGAKEVRNLLQVVPEGAREAVAKSDAEIAEDVKAALAEDRVVADSDVTVQSVNDGVVLLAGTAPTLSAHLRALQVARAVPDVRRVASEIESPGRFTDAEDRGEREGAVGHKTETAMKATGQAAKKAAEATGETAKDAGNAALDAAKGAGDSTSDAARDMWITSATKLRLIADPDAPALDINVDTTGGEVTLFGMVGSQAAKQAAEAEARKVNGVKSVRNELQVVPAEQQARVMTSDAELQRAVETSLDKHESLNEADIDVAVKDGVVRLTGTVPSQSARLTAAVAARSTAGVRSVLQDDLRIEGSDRLSRAARAAR